MTTRPSSTPKRLAGDASKRGVALLAALLTALPAPQVLGQAPAAAPAPTAAPVSGVTPAPAQADDPGALVARIALYPDDLVAIILPASTNPLQIVQAERFLAKRKTDPKAPIDEKWDDAVKSLVNYPEVITMMSGDLDWTAALGEAVVADQAAVLEAVQAFRRKTQSAGNLKSDEKQTVVVEKEVITIVPTDPQVIYVPQYNPTTVVVSGYVGWGYYPSPYPVYYYPYAPGAAFAAGLVWGAAMGAIWGGGSLRRELRRRRHQHQPQHQHQHRRYQLRQPRQRQPRFPDRRRRREVELGQAEGPGEQVGRRQPALVARG